MSCGSAYRFWGVFSGDEPSSGGAVRALSLARLQGRSDQVNMTYMTDMT